jgi:hypothetical protein
VSREFFEQVADAVVGFVPPDLGECATRLSSINLKLWFGSDGPNQDGREHYEAQFLSDGQFEIGFHCEHRAVERNEAVLRRLTGHERAWRKLLGPDATPGEFLGMEGGPWRRLSEVVPVPRPLDVEAAMDVADRLATYAEAIEPLRRSETSGR